MLYLKIENYNELRHVQFEHIHKDIPRFNLFLLLNIMKAPSEILHRQKSTEHAKQRRRE